MNKNYFYACIVLCAILMLALWSGWESVLPMWARITLTLAVGSGCALAGPRAVQGPAGSAKVILAVAVVGGWLIYLFVPFSSNSVSTQVFRSVEHIFEPTSLSNSPENFSDWFARGHVTHDASPFFHWRFENTARRHVMLTLSDIQRHPGTLAEIEQYEQWEQILPSCLDMLNPSDMLVMRMRQVLRDTKLVREALAKCQAAVKSGDMERLPTIIAELEMQCQLKDSEECLGVAIHRLSAHTQQLKLLSQ